MTATEFCRDCANDNIDRRVVECENAGHWEKRLRLGVDTGTSMFLVYGYNDHWRETPKEQAHKLVYAPRKRKPTPRTLIRAAIHGNPLPPVAEISSPEWGYVGGYSAEGRRIKATPGTIRRQKIQEENDCSQIAVTPRRK